MNTLILLVFIAALLPYLAKVPVAIAMNKLGGYDNENPREQQTQLKGFGARALAAHQNAFESLIIFGTAIAVALATSSTSDTIINLAIVHVIARILYSIMYYLNKNVLRSLSWAVATICSFTIIWLSMN
jgi:uncharacterized MAPEG superfamily protein